MDDEILQNMGKIPPGWLEFCATLAAIILVILLVFAWVYFFRKRGVKIRHRRYRHREQPDDRTDKTNHHHRHRHRRRINPTLAETGGLPPMREEDKPPQP